ncbi:MAG: DUF501 domain-containing protein [Thermovirgaceae bacterium]|nr:DUF501 domain-containing protein [Thermovirgaceae bacterium]
MLPPVFFERPLPEDIVSAKRQARGRNFTAALVRGVSRRCRHGFPQVVVCGPLRKGLPFPTTFWLTCPYLSHRANSLESAAAVPELGDLLRGESKEDWILFNHEHALVRVFLMGPSMAESLREKNPSAWEALTRTGVGGIRVKGTFSVKCLHLQTASMIGLGWHPAEEWLIEKLGDLECGAPGDWPCAGH